MTRWAGIWATSMVNEIFKVESLDGMRYHGVGLRGQAVRTEAITPLTVEDMAFMEVHYALETKQRNMGGTGS